MIPPPTITARAWEGREVMIRDPLALSVR